jgi:hypothetical protein
MLSPRQWHYLGRWELAIGKGFPEGEPSHFLLGLCFLLNRDAREERISWPRKSLPAPCLLHPQTMSSKRKQQSKVCLPACSLWSRASSQQTHKQPYSPGEEDANSGRCWAIRRVWVSVQQEMMVFLLVDLTSLLLEDITSVKRARSRCKSAILSYRNLGFWFYYWMAHYSTPREWKCKLKRCFELKKKSLSEA